MGGKNRDEDTDKSVDTTGLEASKARQASIQLQFEVKQVPE